MCAGIISQVYGTRDIYRIRGVLRRMPLVGTALILAALGITGAPFFNGSISKYFIIAGAGRMVSAALIFINLGTIISFIKYSQMLFGHAGESGGSGYKPDMLKQAAVIILGGLCFLGGLFGELAIRFLFNLAVSVDAAGYREKALLFAVSLIIGYFIYRFFVASHPFFKKIREIDLSFRLICLFIGGFFAVILIVARLG